MNAYGRKKNKRDAKNRKEDIQYFISKHGPLERLNEGYKRRSMPKFWADIVEVLIRFIIKKGRCRMILGYHLSLLNYFSSSNRDYVVNFLFILFNSLDRSITKARKLKKDVPLHQKLILIPFKHTLIPQPDPTILPPNPKDIPHLYSSILDSSEDDIPLSQLQKKYKAHAQNVTKVVGNEGVDIQSPYSSIGP